MYACYVVATTILLLLFHVHITYVCELKVKVAVGFLQFRSFVHSFEVSWTQQYAWEMS